MTELIHRTYLTFSAGKAKAACKCGWRGRMLERGKAVKSAQRHAEKYAGEFVPNGRT